MNQNIYPLKNLVAGIAATNPATHFIGTTDNQPLVVRTNSTEAMRVLPSGYVGVNLTTPANRFAALRYHNKRIQF
jgi:hypothetical protein